MVLSMGSITTNIPADAGKVVLSKVVRLVKITKHEPVRAPKRMLLIPP